MAENDDVLDYASLEPKRTAVEAVVNMNDEGNGPKARDGEGPRTGRRGGWKDDRRIQGQTLGKGRGTGDALAKASCGDRRDGWATEPAQNAGGFSEADGIEDLGVGQTSAGRQGRDV
jgi:hypothetical protein